LSNIKVTVGTTNISVEFENPIKTMLLYNTHASQTIYYNLDQNKKGIANTDDFQIPSGKARFIGEDETKNRKIKFINLIASGSSTILLIDYVTWAETKNDDINMNIIIKERLKTLIEEFPS